MAYCPNCSAVVERTALGCPKCGAAFGGGSAWEPVEQGPQPASAFTTNGKGSARTRRIVAAVAGASTLALVLWAYSTYREYQRRADVTKRKAPFAGVVIVGVADAESLLEKKGLLKRGPQDAPRVACSLDTETCGMGLVSNYSIGPEGVVKIELSGARHAALEGKKILLTPLLADGAVAWKCLTDVAPEFVPAPGDPPGIQGGRCDFGKPVWPKLPPGSEKAKDR